MGIIGYCEVGLIIVNLFVCIMLLISYCNCNRGLLLSQGLVVIGPCILGLTFIFLLFFQIIYNFIINTAIIIYN